MLGWDERSQKDKPEERRNCGCRRERLFNRFKRRSDPRLSYEAQSQKNGKSRKKRFSRTAPAPVATRATLVHGLGRCASSSPGGSSFPRYRRRDRSAQTDRARREARRIRPITLRPRGTTQSPMAQLTDSMSNLAEEFPTRIMECGLLPLTCAGVEVANKLHVTCTVVKGAPPASPARAVTTHETAATQSRGVAHRFPFPRSSPVPVPPVPVERSQNRGSHSAITGHQQFLSAEQVQHHRGGGVHDSARQHGFGHFPRAAGGRPEDTKAAAVRRGDSRRHLEVQPHP